MIVTLTPNPSIDRTIELDSVLERGAVLRATGVTSQAAGKGVNISRAAVAAGVPTVAVLPVDPDDPFVHELVRDGIACHCEPPAGDVRMNVTLTEPDGTTTKINSPGATVDAGLLARLLAALHTRAASARWVVLAGSLPPGSPVGWYAEVVADLRDLDVQVAVDTSDAPLQAIADSLESAAPDLLKPNAEELAGLTDGDAAAIEADPTAAAEAARRLLDRGVGAVLATLGAGGAVLVTETGAWHAVPPPTVVISTVGAGDSSLFGYLLGSLRGASSEDCLRLAVAYGSAAAALPGTTIPTPDHVHGDLVEVVRLPNPVRVSVTGPAPHREV